MSKITLRVATKDPYCYLEELLGDEDVRQIGKGIKERYDSLYALMNGKETPPDSFYDHLIHIIDSGLTKWGQSDFYTGLNEKQVEVVQALKRMSKRIPKLG